MFSQIDRRHGDLSPRVPCEVGQYSEVWQSRTPERLYSFELNNEWSTGSNTMRITIEHVDEALNRLSTVPVLYFRENCNLPIWTF